MELHLESTIFGQLVRLLSRGKLLRYPDEIDPSLWEKAVSRDSPDNSNGEREKEEDDGRSVLLVGWYGPDDPEVSLRPSLL
jgi:DHA1 family multidrug resistance protein-like MFS transporter